MFLNKPKINRRLAASFFLLAIFIFKASIASADCTSPAAVKGSFRYFSNNYHFCDSKTWLSLNKSVTATACATPGELKYEAGDLRYCQGGTNLWVSMDSVALPLKGTCTSAGAFRSVLNLIKNSAEWCDGTNWKEMVASNFRYFMSVHTSTAARSLYDVSDWSGGVQSFDSQATVLKFNPTATLVAMGQTSSPYIEIRQTSNFISTVTIPVPPTSQVNDVAFSPDGSLMVLALAASPYIAIYNTSDWSKVTNPSTLPTGLAQSVAFSPSGSQLAIAHSGSPRVTIYTVSGWSKITNPSVLPAGQGTSVAYSPNGAFLAVGHFTTPFVTIYNTSDWSKVTNPTTLPTGVPNDLQFSYDSSKLVIVHNVSPFMTAYNTLTWAKFANPATMMTLAGQRVVFNPDGNTVAVTTGGRLIVYNLSDWSVNQNFLLDNTAMDYTP